MNDEQPIVYLLQEPTPDKDLTSAANLGKIQVILTTGDNPGFNIFATLEKLTKVLCNYRPRIDFICFAGGDPIVQFCTGIVIEKLAYEEVTYLIWNREKKNGVRTGTGFYFPKPIRLRNKE